MSNHAWVSSGWADATLVEPVNTDIASQREQDAIEGVKLSKAGNPVPARLCPNRIWGDDAAPLFKTLPALFLASGQWIVTGKAADIIGQFDQGDGTLHPLEGLYQKDNRTPVLGKYWCWIIGNVKTVLDDAASIGLRKKRVTLPWYHMPIPTKDDDVAINGLADHGPAAWIDPTLFNAFFVSGALGDALASVGLAKAFRLYRCRMSMI